MAELRRWLIARGASPADVELVVAELVAGGYLDDARYARRFAEDRRRLDGWGAERIARRLAQVGVDREVVEAALADADPDAEEQAALALLRRRFTRPPGDQREWQRALGVLLRKGYAPEVAIAALRAHAADAPAEGLSDSSPDASFAPEPAR